jgi:hypothetical protein
MPFALSSIFLTGDAGEVPVPFPTVAPSTPGDCGGSYLPNPLGGAGDDIPLIDGDFVTFAGQVIFANEPKPPIFEFEAPSSSSPERLLIHRYRADDHSGPAGNGYFSLYQVNTPATAAPQFRFPGVVKVDGTATAKTLYARVIDPPSAAPYGSPTANDNRDMQNPRGKLFYYDDGGQRIDSAADGVLTLVARAGGVPGAAKLFLEATDHAAGDNYQLEVDFDPSFSCATAGPGGTDTCAKSMIVTAWKRQYLEKHRMFRRGSHVSGSSNAQQSEIWVTDVTPFQSGDTVRLIHAPVYDYGGIGSSTPAPSNLFYKEDHIIDVIPVTTTAAGVSIPAHLRLRSNDVLANGYDVDPSFDPANHVGLPYLADFVGIVSGATSSDFFEADYGRVPGLFADAFVDFLEAPTPVPELPFERPLPYSQFIMLLKKWSQNVQRVGSTTQVTPFLNHIFVGAMSETTSEKITINNVQYLAIRLGDTLRDPKVTLVYRGRIERSVTEPPQAAFGQNPDAVTRRITAHELSHQWPTNLPQEHCAFDEYQHDGRWCIMHEPASSTDPHRSEIGDPSVSFHFEITPQGVDSEYLIIRDAQDK